MPETPPIPPALSEAEWQARVSERPPTEIEATAAHSLVITQNGQRVYLLADELPRVVALANAARHDRDRGKITRAIVDDLRIAQHEARKAVAADCANGPCGECLAACERFCARLEAHALALESILPPAPAPR